MKNYEWRLSVVFTLALAAQGQTIRGTVAGHAAGIGKFSRQPLHFEPLAGGQFVARSGAMSVQVSATGATLGGHGMSLGGTSPAARPVAEGLLPGRSHYLIGADPRRWRTHSP
jgi:hypothetical protein